MAETENATNPSVVRAKNYERDAISQPTGGDDRNKILKTTQDGRLHFGFLPNSSLYWECLVTTTPAAPNEYTTVEAALNAGHTKILIDVATISETSDITSNADGIHISGYSYRDSCIWSPMKVTLTGNNCIIEGITIGADGTDWQIYLNAAGGKSGLSIHNCKILNSDSGTGGLAVGASTTKAVIAADGGTTVLPLDSVRITNCIFTSTASNSGGPDNYILLAGGLTNVVIEDNVLTENVAHGTTRTFAKLGVKDAGWKLGDDAVSKINISIKNNMMDQNYSGNIFIVSGLVYQVNIENNKELGSVSISSDNDGTVLDTYIKNNHFNGGAASRCVYMEDTNNIANLYIKDNTVICSAGVSVPLCEMSYSDAGARTYDETTTNLRNCRIIGNQVGGYGGEGLDALLKIDIVCNPTAAMVSNINDILILDNSGETYGDAALAYFAADTSAGPDNHTWMFNKISIKNNSFLVGSTLVFRAMYVEDAVTLADDTLSEINISDNKFECEASVSMGVRLIECNLDDCDNGINIYGVSLLNNIIDARSSSLLEFKGLYIDQAYAAAATMGITSGVLIQGNIVKGDAGFTSSGAILTSLYESNNAADALDIVVRDNSLEEIHCPIKLVYFDGTPITAGGLLGSRIVVENNIHNRTANANVGIYYSAIEIISPELDCEFSDISISKNVCDFQFGATPCVVGNIYMLYYIGPASTADKTATFLKTSISSNTVHFVGTNAHAADTCYANIDNELGMVIVENIEVIYNKFYGQTALFSGIRLEGEQYDATAATFSKALGIQVIGNKNTHLHNVAVATILKWIELIDVTGYIHTADEADYQGDWQVKNNIISGSFDGNCEFYLAHLNFNSTQELMLNSVHLDYNIIDIKGAPVVASANGFFVASAIHNGSMFRNITVSHNIFSNATAGYFVYIDNNASDVTIVVSRLTASANRGEIMTEVIHVDVTGTGAPGGTINGFGNEGVGSTAYWDRNKVFNSASSFVQPVAGTGGLVNDGGNAP